MTAALELYLDDDDRAYPSELRESNAETKYLVLCGARWVNHRDQAAASELIDALDSGSEELVLLAGALLTEGCACA